MKARASDGWAIIRGVRVQRMGEWMSARAAFEDHLRVLTVALDVVSERTDEAVGLVSHALRTGGKVLICGNGGSAADAQHFAAELVGRYRRDRIGYACIALTTDTSALTAIGNDLGFDRVFARQVEALGRSGDVLIAISTSGNSPNVLLAAHEARRRGLKVIGMTARSGGKLASLVDLLVAVPADDTARTQEIHILALHALADGVEAALQGVS
jgi:D-sedoheptulose 7-phosphate isomerase